MTKVLSKINPNILDYKDINNMVVALFDIIENEKKYEIVIFEGLLGLI